MLTFGDSIREPVLFFKKDNLLIGHLIFYPIELKSVEIWDEIQCYKEIKEYDIIKITKKGEGAEITIQSDKIPSITRNECTKPHGSPNSYPSTRDGKYSLLHSEDGLFLKLQTIISYTYDEMQYAKSPFFSDKRNQRLHTVEKLINENLPVDIFIIGDSISEGYNSSGFMNLPPYQDNYGQLLLHMIRERYESKFDSKSNSKSDTKCVISLLNKSLGGTNSVWGKKNIGKFIIENSAFGFDLNIIAFGANDSAGKIKPDKFKKNIMKIIKAILKKNNNAEFVLISTITPNPLWINTHTDIINLYRAELNKIASQFEKMIAIADLTKVWTELMKIKGFYDLTGNGINHPNDFGHLLYALKIFECL